MKLLICVNDKPHKRGYPLNIKAGVVYTEVDRYKHCRGAVEFVQIAEAKVSCPYRTWPCKGCKGQTPAFISGWYDARRFRPFLPPEQLTNIEEVTKLNTPSKITEEV